MGQPPNVFTMGKRLEIQVYTGMTVALGMGNRR